MDYKLPDNLFKDILSNLGILFVPSERNNFYPRFLQSKALLFCVVCLIAIKIVYVGLFLGLPKNMFFADITKVDLLYLLNQDRTVMGLEPLIENAKLDIAAQMKANDIMQNDYFAHQSPTGLTPWYWFKQAGYTYKYAGENLAIGFFDSKEVYKAWLNSPSHRENLLNPKYKDIGTAVLAGNFEGNDTTVVVQLFGTVQPNAIVQKPTKPVENTKIKTNTNDQTVQNKDNTNAKVETTDEVVLSETSAYPVIKSSDGRLNLNTTYLQILNLIYYNTDELIKNISQWLLAISSLALVFNIFIRFDIQRKDLILRSCMIIGLLYISSFVGKETISQIIFHQVII